MLKPGGEQLQPHPGTSAGWRWINPATWQKVHDSSPAAGTQELPDLIETRSSTERQYVIRPKHCRCRVNSIMLFEQGWTSECVIQNTCWCPVWFWSGSRNLTNTLIAWSSQSLGVCLHRLRVTLPRELSGSSERESGQSIGTPNSLENGYASNLLDIPAVSYINVAALLL